MIGWQDAFASAHRRRDQAPRHALDPFVGASPAIRSLAEDARRFVAAESPVLIRGETGTGKGVLAGWLHRNGPRADEAFVDLNCATLSKDLDNAVSLARTVGSAAPMSGLAAQLYRMHATRGFRELDPSTLVLLHAGDRTEAP